MKIGSGIVIGKDDAAGASAVRKAPEDRRERTTTLTLLEAARLVQSSFMQSQRFCTQSYYSPST
jgi:hypothetical protein